MTRAEAKTLRDQFMGAISGFSPFFAMLPEAATDTAWQPPMVTSSAALDYIMMTSSLKLVPLSVTRVSEPTGHVITE